LLMATDLIDIGTLITTTPGVRGGRPYVVGAGVSVRRVVDLAYRQGLSVEQIVEQMPHLTLAGVYAALAYYHANKEQLDAEFAVEDSEATRLEEDWLREQGRAEAGA
jgi:uncharacterized protein (DUF433 family)